MAEKVMDLNRFQSNPPGPHTPVRLSIQDADTLTFTCDDPFQIIDIHVEGAHDPGYVFHRSPPFDSTKGSDNIHRANTGSPKAGTKGSYKVTFKRLPNGPVIDPHFIVE